MAITITQVMRILSIDNEAEGLKGELDGAADMGAD